MKIDDTIIQQTDVLKQQVRSSETGKNQEQPGGERIAPSPDIEENVEISSRAQERRSARDALSSVPEVRAQKVAEVRKKIEEGTYEVNSGKIAEKLIRESLFHNIA